MNFYVMTLFPDMVKDGLHTSVIGRAIEKGAIHIETVNIRDFTKDRHRHVDDYPYGGGAGMVMQPQPVYDCYEHIVEKLSEKPRVVYMNPQGQVFNQKKAEELSREEILFFCAVIMKGLTRECWMRL